MELIRGAESVAGFHLQAPSCCKMSVHLWRVLTDFALSAFPAPLFPKLEEMKPEDWWKISPRSPSHARADKIVTLRSSFATPASSFSRQTMHMRSSMRALFSRQSRLLASGSGIVSRTVVEHICIRKVRGFVPYLHEAHCWPLIRRRVLMM